MRWEFKAGPRMRALAKESAIRMTELFGISEEEASGRVNRLWRGMDFGEEAAGGSFVESPTAADLALRESPTYWAKTIYYGDKPWWKGEEGLEALPYP